MSVITTPIETLHLKSTLRLLPRAVYRSQRIQVFPPNIFSNTSLSSPLRIDPISQGLFILLSSISGVYACWVPAKFTLSSLMVFFNLLYTQLADRGIYGVDMHLIISRRWVWILELIHSRCALWDLSFSILCYVGFE